MATSVGGLIESSDFNSIRNTVELVLGSGDGAQIGYGQTLTSSEVSPNDIVRAQDMIDLYADLFAARVHQTGNPPNWISASDGLAAPTVDDLVGYFAGATGSDGTSATATTDTDKGFLDFEAAAQEVLDDIYLVGAGQMSATQIGSSVKTSSWNGSINHVFTVTFSSADQRRYYFNSGGEIRLDANLTGGTSVPGNETQTPPGTKDEIWQTMLNTMGTIKFGRTNTTSTGSGSGTATGNYDLTSSYQRLFTKDGSGVYAENVYYIDARSTSPTTIQFRIVFQDNDTGDDTTPTDPYPNAIDENVTGDITSTVTTFRATGTVNVPNPNYTLNSAL